MGATYLYAIIPTGDEVTFDVAGVDDDRDEVYTVPHRDLAAVVSASPLADYRGLKRNEAVRYLVAHQRVVEAVMQAFPVLPVSFGTVLPDEARVRRLLAQGDSLFRPTLERFADQVQMEVVVLWDLQEVFQEIGQEEHIVQLKAQVKGRPADETTVERVAIGQMVHAALEERRDALQSHLIPSLREVALDLVTNPLMDDSMVANVALLLDKTEQEALDQQLKLLDEEFEEGEHSGSPLNFRCVGPLPPYSFATVEARVLSFEMVDEARRNLGLGETVTPGEVKRAYRELAGRLHPDHNPGDPEAEVRMAELTQAYKLLTAYVESQTLGKPNAPCALSRKTVEQTLLIAIRRQEMPA
jgi:hypothetical protein